MSMARFVVNVVRLTILELSLGMVGRLFRQLIAVSGNMAAQVVASVQRLVVHFDAREE